VIEAAAELPRTTDLARNPATADMSERRSVVVLDHTRGEREAPCMSP